VKEEPSISTLLRVIRGSRDQCRGPRQTTDEESDMSGLGGWEGERGAARKRAKRGDPEVGKS